MLWSKEAACAILFAAALTTSCTRQGSLSEQRARVAESDVDITIAAVWPWEAHPDLRYGQGLDLAAEEINAAGGVLGRGLQILQIDDHQSVNQGRLVAQRLADDPQVMAVIGHLQSYVTVPAASIYDRAGLVLIAPAATSEELTSRGYSRVFRATMTDREIGRQTVEFAARRGYRRTAIYYVRNSYGRALANAFEQRAHDLGLSVVARQSFDPNQGFAERTLEPIVREWSQMGLDALFLASEVPVAGRLIAEIRSAGIDAPILGPDAMSSPSLIRVGGAAVEGTVVTSFFHPDDPRAEVQRFVSSFRHRYHQDPDVASAKGYDAVRLIAEAMVRAGSPSPSRVAEALRDIEAWTGVTGPVTFDEKGDLVDRTAVHLIVRDGNFDYLPAIGSVNAATSPGGAR